MSARKKLPSPAHARADELLRVAAALKTRLEEEKDRYDAETRQVKERFTELVAPTVARLKETEKEIEALATRHQVDLFGTPDKDQAAAGVRCGLPSGSLILTVRQVVRKAKAVTVEALKGLGWLDGVRVEESVAWDKIEGWTDERLAVIGTERKDKASITWEAIRHE
ncbi:Bacteriophage Mu Gam like protein [Desulfonatronum thiosulfatophilum]|uniref:Bacteriophage Mu Gam like protein n=1 Tax=Desulfonatronum thiosulfatophilum TaxID=617002 RepID=A0A1G6A529_9BACT|nr:host-nuclease inhibitor Gam family protein [Desulfonatronum thiosulfatophilum]SDB03529.1 Bacteriophage Mu Gam like protein [Desulfonatronum thiosulfatophilum]